MMANYIPVFGDIKAAYEIGTGKDLITGEKLETPKTKHNKASKAAASIGQKSKYINLENSCPAPANTGEPGFLLKTLSTIADFVPFLGNAKAAFEASEGYNPITKEELSDLDRGIATASILLGGIGRVGGKGGKLAVDFFSNSKNATNASESASQAERISKNIEESRNARDSSNFNDYSNKEKEILENKGTGNGERVLSSVDDLSDVAKSKITNSQRATLNQQERTYSHLTEMDFKRSTEGLSW